MIGEQATSIWLARFCDIDNAPGQTARIAASCASLAVSPDRPCIATHKDQYQEVPGSPLCHISVSSWIMKAGSKYGAPDRKDRCAKVTADVVYQAVAMLNAHVERSYTPVKAALTQPTLDCMTCHGKEGDHNVTVQQDCRLCHDDHTL